MRAIVLLAAVAALIVASHGQGAQANYPQKHIAAEGIANAKVLQAVQNICDKAHREINGTSELACGQAQAQTGTEYLCNGTSVNAYCWVETQ